MGPQCKTITTRKIKNIDTTNNIISFHLYHSSSPHKTQLESKLTKQQHLIKQNWIKACAYLVFFTVFVWKNSPSLCSTNTFPSNITCSGTFDFKLIKSVLIRRMLRRTSFSFFSLCFSTEVVIRSFKRSFVNSSAFFDPETISRATATNVKC